MEILNTNNELDANKNRSVAKNKNNIIKVYSVFVCEESNRCYKLVHV